MTHRRSADAPSQRRRNREPRVQSRLVGWCRSSTGGFAPCGAGGLRVSPLFVDPKARSRFSPATAAGRFNPQAVTGVEVDADRCR